MDVLGRKEGGASLLNQERLGFSVIKISEVRVSDDATSILHSLSRLLPSFSLAAGHQHKFAYSKYE